MLFGIASHFETQTGLELLTFPLPLSFLGPELLNFVNLVLHLDYLLSLLFIYFTINICNLYCKHFKPHFQVLEYNFIKKKE